MRLLVFTPSILLGAATAVAAYSEPILAIPLGFLTVLGIAVTAMAYPPAAYVETETIERLFPEES